MVTPLLLILLMAWLLFVSMIKTEPTFKAEPYEMQALSLIQLLKGQSSTITLKTEERRRIESLASALCQGNKTKALQLSAEFYQPLLSAEKAAAAYFLVKELKLSGNPDFQIVMDSLKDHYEQATSSKDKLELDDALIILLLVITRSDKNSISYNRIDENTGKIRPTTFPLTQKLIYNFLEPFGDKQHLARRVLLFVKQNVLGNPAAEIAHRYQLRKAAYDQEKAAYDQALTATAQVKAEAKAPAKPTAAQDIELLTTEFDKMLEFVKEAEAQKAVMHSFQFKQLRALVQVHQKEPNTFSHKLTKVYSQHLSFEQSSQLSARLASRMKRLMNKLGNWKEEYWQEYQATMQKMGVWEGEEWLKKWRANKTGKQIIAKSGKDYLLEEKPVTVEDMLDKADKIKDKLKGQHMLSPAEAAEWLQRANPSKAPPEQQKVLDALSRTERLDDLIELALEPEHWQGLPASLQLKTYQLFSQLSHTDLDQIKAELSKGLEPELLDAAKQLMALLELQINKVAALFKKDFKLSYAQAIEILTRQADEIRERERLNSKEYQNSPAAQYARYQTS